MKPLADHEIPIVPSSRPKAQINQALVARLTAIAEQQKATPAQIALAWLLYRRSAAKDGFTPRFLLSYDVAKDVTINAQASKGFRCFLVLPQFAVSNPQPIEHLYIVWLFLQIALETFNPFLPMLPHFA